MIQVSQCMTPAGVKYVIMYDSSRSQVSPCMTPAGVKYDGMYDSCRSQVSQCMTPVGLYRRHYLEIENRLLVRSMK